MGGRTVSPLGSVCMERQKVSVFISIHYTSSSAVTSSSGDLYFPALIGTCRGFLVELFVRSL
jgi:hypothetical protein